MLHVLLEGVPKIDTDSGGRSDMPHYSSRVRCKGFWMILMCYLPAWFVPDVLEAQLSHVDPNA